MEKLTLQEALVKLRELTGTQLDTITHMNFIDLIASTYMGGYEEGVAATLKIHAPEIYDTLGH